MILIFWLLLPILAIPLALVALGYYVLSLEDPDEIEYWHKQNRLGRSN